MSLTNCSNHSFQNYCSIGLLSARKDTVSEL